MLDNRCAYCGNPTSEDRLERTSGSAKYPEEILVCPTCFNNKTPLQYNSKMERLARKAAKEKRPVDRRKYRPIYDTVPVPPNAYPPPGTLLQMDEPKVENDEVDEREEAPTS